VLQLIDGRISLANSVFRPAFEPVTRPGSDPSETSEGSNSAALTSARRDDAALVNQ
jgi:hypothetical protein